MMKFKNWLESNTLYHGTSVGAAIAIQRIGHMIPKDGNKISFTSKKTVAQYYATMKGGFHNGLKGVILRIKNAKKYGFILSPKYEDNKDGFEWTTTYDIHASDLEVLTLQGWIPLPEYDFIA